MFRNFIVITLRSLVSQRVYTFISVLGLAVGMASTLLIVTYVIHELSFDKIHRDAHRIYRVTVDGELRGSDLKIAVTSLPMAQKLVEEYPEIESSVRIGRFGAWLVSNDSVRFNEDNLLFTDPQFFNFFSFQLLSGNPDSALVRPRSIVLSRSAALRYFGNEEILGKQLQLETESEPYIITGVMEDVPSNSHIHFDMVASLITLNKYLRPVWVSHNVYTYIKTKEGIDYKALEPKLNNLAMKYVVPQLQEYLDIPIESFTDGSNVIHYKLQPLLKIHMNSDLDNELEPNSKSMYVYAFSAIALLILLIACLNFINLSTANSANRAREVILRKVIGSERRMLIFQFLTESVLMCLFALVLALIIVEIVMPYFNNYLNISLSLQILNNPIAILLIVFSTFLLGIVAGTYPAFFIASYEPVRVLHGVLNKGIKTKHVRSFFVIIQLSISILIIILSMVVFAQLEYMMNKELGFEKERILVIRRPDALKERITDFREEILRHPNIESVTNSNSIPGRDFLASTFQLEEDSSSKYLIMNQLFVNYDFREAFELSMIKGRFFSPAIESDTIACVINEEAALEFNSEKIIGTSILAPAFKEKMGDKLKVIGIVKNFHFETVDKKIGPLIITLMPGNWEGYLNVRLSSNEIDKSIKLLEETWKKYTSEYPFQYFFLDQDFDRNYRSVIRIARILLIFASLSIFVACLGLFGLVLFTTNQRIQEIGIRKAFGATYFHIIGMLIKETAILNIYASAFAWIAAYLISLFWLKAFYSRITLSPTYFFIASAIVLVMSVLVVLYQAIRGSRRDPVDALKAE